MKGHRQAFRSYLAACAFGVNMVACAGGQSGNEGDLPAPPCANDGALVTGTILALAEGCVTLDVVWVAKDGLPISNGDGRELFSGSAEPGDQLRGRIGQHYSYSHTFVVGETVVALPTAWGETLELQLMPLHGEDVDLQWGPASFSATLDELKSPECQATIRDRAESAADGEDAASNTGRAMPVARAADAVEPSCGD